jgi:hypothetical protein
MANRNDSMSRDVPEAIGTLVGSPRTASTHSSRKTIQMTMPHRAPRAMRMPISLVRHATV